MSELGVEIWSDLVCPWCFIAKRRFELALGEFEHRADVRVRWRAFQLDPAAPTRSTTTISERMGRNLGMHQTQIRAQLDRITGLAAELGLNYRVGDARVVNSFDVHRLQAYADDVGIGDAVRERLMRAYTEERADLGSPQSLVQLATEAGLDPDQARRIVAGHDYAEAVQADGERARRLGINGVPAFLFAGRYLVSGAQPAGTFLDMLRMAWERTAAHAPVGPGQDGPATR
ncbi:DsbA family oxidoreductase [Streptomyces rugosispiralis]|uniref:DsbA family oxidoreductase n=1 Tax=Streptomyces rugosispiralis TaxID=2967341 RepID=A0ABT1VBY7_9ACTN|nr:DsbA family oxidoreductase [Streptomyces rugosispiralis]MCQ8194309.1 DsbA family oxidoreductase [Streptomyces rugosispiralis]